MKYLYVCVFAFIGGSLRYEISLLLNGDYPIGTLLINLSGSMLLGFLLGRMKESHFKTGITAGFVGSFTTFSTFSLETVNLLEASLMLGVSYIIVTVAGGIMCAAIGMKVGG